MSDYRVVETLDDRGRVRSTSEYVGAPYVYARDGETVRRARLRAAVGCLAGWAAYGAALAPASTMTRAAWVALPFALTALPLGITTNVAFRLFTAREPFEHRHADLIENRAPAATFFIMLLSVVALIGAAVCALRGAALNGGDGLAPEQLRAYRFAAIRAALAVVLVFGAVFALFIDFCDFIWFR